MDVRRADLHMHTTCSDGGLAPAELVRKARQHGLTAVAVTDHDTVDGLPEAREAGQRLGVEVISGVELSVTVGTDEIHLLGYFFDDRHPGLQAHFERFREVRRERAEAIVERLNEAGVPLTFEEVARQAGGGALGRPHVAMALVERGLVGSYNEAFDRYLRDGGTAHVAKPIFPAEEALRLLHDAGGIGVLAHPGHWTTERLVRHLVGVGLDGIETIHPSHDHLLTRYYRGLVSDHGLIETGGSDYHGLRPQDDENLSRYSIPYPQLERIRRPAA